MSHHYLYYYALSISMVLSTLIYIALIIIVIIVIVVLLRFLFNALFVMPVTLEHEYIVKYASSLYLPT